MYISVSVTKINIRYSHIFNFYDSKSRLAATDLADIYFLAADKYNLGWLLSASKHKCIYISNYEKQKK